MKLNVLICAALLGGWSLVGCAPVPATSKLLEVAPFRVDCSGVGPQRCLRVRELPGGSWTLLYAGIEGFAYEEGYLWTLRVREERVANPPADGSAVRLLLLEVLRRLPVEPPGSSATLRPSLAPLAMTVRQEG